MTDEDKVTIQLPRDMARALFEWSYRFMQTGNPQFTHPADAIAVDAVASELEWALPEVFSDAYPELLRTGRARVVSKYRAHMAPQYSAWLDQLRYQNIAPGEVM